MAVRPHRKFEPLAHRRAEHINPLREVLVRLPRLRTTRNGEIDFKNSPPQIVSEIAEHAGETVQALNLGMAAIGSLWAIASVEIDDGTIPFEAVESFGWMLSILSECSAALLVLAAECKQGGSRMTGSTTPRP